MSDKSLVVFDMDGTLVDSSGVIAGAINYVRSHLGLEPLDEQIILQKVNDPAVDGAKFFYNAKSFTPLHEELFSRYYSKHHTKDLRLYGGIKQLLEALKAQGRTLAVATNAYRQSTLEALRHLDIERFFESVVCYDDVQAGKPDPSMLHKILEHTEKSAEEGVFVGDSERDAIAAKRTPMAFVMVGWGFSSHPAAIDSVEALRRYLGA